MACVVQIRERQRSMIGMGGLEERHFVQIVLRLKEFQHLTACVDAVEHGQREQRFGRRERERMVQQMSKTVLIHKQCVVPFFNKEFGTHEEKVDNTQLVGFVHIGAVFETIFLVFLKRQFQGRVQNKQMYAWYHDRLTRLNWIHMMLNTKHVTASVLIQMLDQRKTSTRSKIGAHIIEQDKRYVRLLCDKRRTC